MSWSGSKPFREKWYRIREDENGQREILEANHQWAIEKGQGDYFNQSFNHYFMVDNNWLVRKDVAYQHLFADIDERLSREYKIERLVAKEELDRLFESLRPIQEWVVFLEERINDCELAIQYQLGNIERLQTEFKIRGGDREINYDQELRHHKEKIMECLQKIERLRVEHGELVAKLRNEERMEWHGMECCAEILHVKYEDLMAQFLNQAH
jgi:hypothetical protein